MATAAAAAASAASAAVVAAAAASAAASAAGGVGHMIFAKSVMKAAAKKAAKGSKRVTMGKSARPIDRVRGKTHWPKKTLIQA